MDYPASNRPPGAAPVSMHHSLPSHPMHHPLLSNQLQPINSETHTSMWLDDPYAVSNASASQRDSGFNSRPASLRSIDSTVTNTTGPLHHGANPSGPGTYESMAVQSQVSLTSDHDSAHPQYAELQTAPMPVTRPEPSQVIPELLGLLMEDDPVIVREAVLLTHMLVKEGGESRSEVIRNREVNVAFYLSRVHRFYSSS
jgi:hypothetical protein